MRKRTQITYIRHEPSNKQLEVKTNIMFEFSKINTSMEFYVKEIEIAKKKIIIITNKKRRRRKKKKMYE